MSGPVCAQVFSTMPPPDDVQLLIAEIIGKNPDRWSDATIVFALATFDGEMSLERFLDNVERHLAEVPQESLAVPDPPASGPRLRRR